MPIRAESHQPPSRAAEDRLRGTPAAQVGRPGQPDVGACAERGHRSVEQDEFAVDPPGQQRTVLVLRRADHAEPLDRPEVLGAWPATGRVRRARRTVYAMTQASSSSTQVSRGSSTPQDSCRSARVPAPAAAWSSTTQLENPSCERATVRWLKPRRSSTRQSSTVVSSTSVAPAFITALIVVGPAVRGQERVARVAVGTSRH